MIDKKDIVVLLVAVAIVCTVFSSVSSTLTDSTARVFGREFVTRNVAERHDGGTG
jgi:hypothetical protein